MATEWDAFVAGFPHYLHEKNTFEFRAFKRELGLLKKFSKTYGYEAPIKVDKNSIFLRILMKIVDLFRWIFNQPIEATHPDCLDFYNRLVCFLGHLEGQPVNLSRARALEQAYRALIHAAEPMGIPQADFPENPNITTLRHTFRLFEQIKLDQRQTVQAQRSGKIGVDQRFQSCLRYLEKHPGNLSDFMNIFKPTEAELEDLQAVMQQRQSPASPQSERVLYHHFI